MLKRSNFCSVHSKELMRHYCITCKHLICIECIVDHSGHEFVRKEESSKYPFFLDHPSQKFINFKNSLYFEGKRRQYCEFFEPSRRKDRATHQRGVQIDERNEELKGAGHEVD